MPTTRTMTVSWRDPAETAAAGLQLSGLDYLTSVMEGRLPPPPISSLLGMTARSVTTGSVVFAAEPGEQHYNPIGLVHGGLVATMLDSVTGCAVHTLLPAGAGYATGDIHVRYLKPLHGGRGEITATGTVISEGRRTATAVGEVHDADGRLVAHATATCLLMRPGA